MHSSPVFNISKQKSLAELLKNFNLKEIVEIFSKPEHVEKFTTEIIIKIENDIKNDSEQQHLICPIEQTLMFDPVYYEIETISKKDGLEQISIVKKFFNNATISEWKKNNSTCPITKENISDKKLLQDLDTENKIKQLILNEIEKKKWTLDQLIQDEELKKTIIIRDRQATFFALQDELIEMQKELKTDSELKHEIEYYLDIPSISSAQHHFRLYSNNSIHLWYDEKNEVELLVVINHAGVKKEYDPEEIAEMGLTSEINKFISFSGSESDSKVLALKIRRTCAHMNPTEPTEKVKSFINRYTLAEKKLTAASQTLVNQNILTNKALTDIEQDARQNAKLHPLLQKLSPHKFNKSSKELEHELEKIQNDYSFDNAFDFGALATIFIGISILIITRLIHIINVSNLESTIAKTKEIEQCPTEKMKLSFFGCKKQMNNPTFKRLNCVAEIIKEDSSQLHSSPAM